MVLNKIIVGPKMVYVEGERFYYASPSDVVLTRALWTLDAKLKYIG
jgi:hypothetical protein